MRILVLDDMNERHEKFARLYKNDEVTHCYHFKQAQKIVLNGPLFDLMCLDHDLGEAIKTADYYVDEYNRKQYYTGGDFAYWLTLQKDKYPHKVLVHSVNYSGARNMGATLRFAGIDTLVLPFTSL